MGGGAARELLSLLLPATATTLGPLVSALVREPPPPKTLDPVQQARKAERSEEAARKAVEGAAKKAEETARKKGFGTQKGLEKSKNMLLVGEGNQLYCVWGGGGGALLTALPPPPPPSRSQCSHDTLNGHICCLLPVRPGPPLRHFCLSLEFFKPRAHATRPPSNK